MDEGVAGAWVHAYLHRKQGDTSNAGYWYERAGKPAAWVSFSVTVTNLGTTTLSFYAATLSGANSVDFSFNSGNPPCIGSLAPNATCTFSVFFASQQGRDRERS